MKAIFALMSLVLLVACATPYYPVYSGNPGDYYIAESETAAYYDPYTAVYEDSEPGSLRYLGMQPWWGYTYYSPYFYPHHFSVWYPRSRFGYDWYSGYYPYWCPPHRYVAARRPVTSPPPGETALPVDPRPPAPAPGYPADPRTPAPAPGYPVVALDAAGEPLMIPPGFESRQGNSPAVLVRAPTVSSNSTPIRGSSRYYRDRFAYPTRSSSFSTRSMGASSSSGRSSIPSTTSRGIRGYSPSAPSIHKQ